MRPTSLLAKPPIIEQRVRKISAEGFAFVPNRFLRDRFFASLSQGERSLYFLLTLASDRRGLSYYHYDTICSILEISLDDYVEARNDLIQKDLIAFDGTRFQVLSLPQQPVVPKRVTAPEHHSEHPEIRDAILASLRPDR